MKYCEECKWFEEAENHYGPYCHRLVPDPTLVRRWLPLKHSCQNERSKPEKKENKCGPLAQYYEAANPTKPVAADAHLLAAAEHLEKATVELKAQDAVTWS